MTGQTILNQSGKRNPAAISVIRANEGRTPSPDGIATGRFAVTPLLTTSRDGEMAAMRADLAPGIITHWHSHPSGHLIYVLAGKDQAQTQDSDIVDLHPGDAIWFGPGERRWHGSTDDQSFSFLSIQTVKDQSVVTWFEPVQTKEVSK